MYADPEVYNEEDSSREKARKMSREILKQRNDTTGGTKVRKQGFFLVYHRFALKREKLKLRFVLLADLAQIHRDVCA